MSRVSLPNDAKAGPTKPEVRAALLGTFDLDESDHFVEVGSRTGAVTIEAARRAGRGGSPPLNPSPIDSR